MGSEDLPGGQRSPRCREEAAGYGEETDDQLDSQDQGGPPFTRSTRTPPRTPPPTISSRGSQFCRPASPGSHRIALNFAVFQGAGYARNHGVSTPMRYCACLVVLLLALDARTASAQCASPTVTPTSVSVPSTGSPPSTLSVVTGTSCPWTASSTATWITVTGVTGSGIGWVNYTVAANSTSFTRTGTIVVAGLNGSVTVTINQAAS